MRTTLDYFRELAVAIRGYVVASNADSAMVSWGPVTLRVTKDETRLLTPKGTHILPDGEVTPELEAALERIGIGELDV